MVYVVCTRVFGCFITCLNWSTEKGYDLTFRAPKDVEPAIVEFDAPQFSHVILFAPETKSMCVVTLHN